MPWLRLKRANKFVFGLEQTTLFVFVSETHFFNICFVCMNCCILFISGLISSILATSPSTRCWQSYLYESFIPINSIVFFMAAYRPSSSNLDQLINMVVSAKNELLKCDQVFDQFKNTSTKLLESPSQSYGLVFELLNYRHSLINSDKSLIFKQYIDEEIENTAKCIKNIKTEKKIKISKDKEYKEMINRINESINNDENVLERIKIEKELFYERKTNISTNKNLKLRRKISLGGGIISPVRMYELTKQINIKSKEDKINEWVKVLLEPVEELVLATKLMLPHEKKAEAIKFLESCLERKDTHLDRAFKARSEILMYSLDNEIDRHIENEKQEKYIKEMIDELKNTKIKVNGEWWIVKYSKDIEAAYVQYLLTHRDIDKEALLKKLN